MYVFAYQCEIYAYINMYMQLRKFGSAHTATHIYTRICVQKHKMHAHTATDTYLHT